MVDLELLSAREREIAEAYSGGESYQQIADRLCIAPSTVRTHLSTIFRKLDVSSKLELHQRLAVQPEIPGNSHPALPDKPSIAVLPFENMSADKEQEYFSDGITQDIITALSRSPWLFIIARNTTFTYKNENIDVRRIAKELGVRYVLEGSVRKSGSRIRVAAQLIDGGNGGNVWSEQYDGQLDEVFELQDEITRNVVGSILTKVHLTASDPIETMPRRDLNVWDLTMRGWHLLYNFSKESSEEAQEILNRALELDPDNAEANLVLSAVLHHIALLGFTDERMKTVRRSYEFARRVTRLDPRNEYAHWALGISCMGMKHFEESIAALRKAVELNPNCSVAYGSLGTALTLSGHVDEAIANQQIAIRSNPRDPSIFFRYTGIALAHFLAERYEKCVEWAEKSVFQMPSWYLGHFLRAAGYFHIGEMAKAQSSIRDGIESLPDLALSHLDHLPLRDDAAMDRMRDCLVKSGLG